MQRYQIHRRRLAKSLQRLERRSRPKASTSSLSTWLRMAKLRWRRPRIREILLSRRFRMLRILVVQASACGVRIVLARKEPRLKAFLLKATLRSQLHGGSRVIAFFLTAQAEGLMQRLHRFFHSARFHEKRNVVFGGALRDGDDVDGLLAQC